jgi:hypothetical protein
MSVDAPLPPRQSHCFVIVIVSSFYCTSTTTTSTTLLRKKKPSQHFAPLKKKEYKENFIINR